MEAVKRMRTSAGVIARPEVRTLSLSGSDRVRYLNGMVSCDVAKMSPGTGHWAIKPNNRGRVEGVVRVRMLDDAIELDVRAVVADKVKEVLERFIIMDDCAIADVSDRREVLGVYGPGARAALGNLDPGTLAAEHFLKVGDVLVIRDDWLGVEGYELHTPPGEAAAVRAGITADDVSVEALDAMRIEAGYPIDGVDIDEDTIPMEARLEPAIDFEKGCYIGQEVISRATNLGGIKHILVGFDVGGDAVPPAGAAVMYGDKRTGEVTSSVRSPSLDRVIAMGYVHKTDEFIGNPVKIVADDQAWEATVAALPFVS